MAGICNIDIPLIILMFRVTFGGNCGEKCCFGYGYVGNAEECVECSAGYFGKTCSEKCEYPYFGKQCLGNCKCDIKICDFATGCLKLEVTESPVTTKMNSMSSSTSQFSTTESSTTGKYQRSSATTGSATKMLQVSQHSSDLKISVIALAFVCIILIIANVCVYVCGKVLTARSAPGGNVNENVYENVIEMQVVHV